MSIYLAYALAFIGFALSFALFCWFLYDCWKHRQEWREDNDE